MCTAQKFVQKRLFFKEGRVLLARRKRQDRGKVATQHNHQFIIVWNQFDAANKRTQAVGCLGPRGLIMELIVERRDLFVIDFGHVRMEKGRGLFRAVEKGFEFLLARFQFSAAFFYHFHRQRLFEVKIEDPFKFAVDLLDLGLSRLN
ncbi:hypothetical protein [Brucella pseudintermedia]|uniref:hypothetical protein n=1 Tax=Brucella pseudintermedia TaxID=370111 RepID=UPI001F287854|nr:hypothetical protein [Brucella pseudintermedia]